MTAEADAIGQVVELWCEAFGEPPAILLEPAQMLVLIEARAELAASESTSRQRR
jgi:hypothetical protein